jgi:riboflavin synthase
MFTGLVEEVGIVRGLVHGGEGARLSVQAGMFRAVALGESIAVSGACVTVVDVVGDAAVFDISGETLDRTTLGELHNGSRVNLERALRVGDRLGGHFVQGHVDGIGAVVRMSGIGGGAELVVRPPGGVIPYLVPKGSIAVDGVGLTVVESPEGVFRAAVIPFTLSHTTLGDARPGTRVNIEADILAKYAGRASNEGITEDLLRSYGY